MNVFFDNCTSPRLAAIMDAYLGFEGHRAIHIRDLPCGPHASDLAWIEELSGSGQSWMVVTGDGRIQKNRAERAAYRQAGLRGFVLAPAFQKQPLNEVGALLLWKWPDMEKLFALTEGPILYELPVNRGSRIRSLPL